MFRRVRNSAKFWARMNVLFRAGAGVKANFNLVTQVTIGVAQIDGGW